MLFIHNDVVRQIIKMNECIEVLEQAFRGLETGESVQRGRIDMYVPCERADGYYRWGSMEGANDGIFAIRMKSDVVFWPRDRSGAYTEDKYCIKPGTYCGLVMLFSTQNGEPLGFINDAEISNYRVGGGAGIGAKYLARKNASKVGMLGSGGMARTFLEAFCAVRPIRSCRVYSPTKANREAYAREMSAKLGIDVVAVDAPELAVRGADIVSSCTDSMTPTVNAEWLEPGMHVTDVYMDEIDDACLDRFDVKIRQGEYAMPLPEADRIKRRIGHSPLAYIGGTKEQMLRLPEKTPLKHNKLDMGWPSYCDLFFKRATGRENDQQITYFHNSGNQGLQFSSVSGYLYRKAKKMGLGREFPTEWFLEDIRD